MISKLLAAFDSPGPWLDYLCIVLMVAAVVASVVLAYRTGQVVR